MKTLHRIDFFVQAFILITCLGSLLFSPIISFAAFFIGLGVWQPLMALFFGIGPRPHAIRERKYYENILLALIVLNIPCLFLYEQLDGSYMWNYFYVMLPIGFIMGIWNFSIAYREFELLRREHQVWDLE